MECRAVATILILAGCGPGSVKIDGQDAFGPVRSAVWFEIESDTETRHHFGLLSAPRACAAAQELLPAAAAEEARLVEDLEPIASDIDAQCPVYRDHYARMAEITDPLFADGLNLVSVVLRDPTAEAEGAPPEGSYGAFDPEDEGLYYLGSLTYHRESPYRIRADAFDCGANAEALDAALEASTTTWYLGDGAIEASLKGDDAYRLSLDTAIEEIQGEDAGALRARGRFERCTVTVEGATSVSL